jgi:hypothetical protein
MNALDVNPRALDHLVLPTASLDVARKRLTTLGFTVAPIGIHPFGTENCCIYFSDGTFLEPLAVRDDRVVREAARNGNVFVARDAAYRFRRGEEGFSALVMATDNAQADHQIFTEGGFSAGPMLSFSRPFTDAAGNTDEASFKLAFAADLRSPDLFAFTCQRVKAPEVDRSALQRHANGAKRITRIVLSSPKALGYGDFVLLVANAASASVTRYGLELDAANVAMAVVDNSGLQSEFGIRGESDPGLVLSAIVFGVSDLVATAALFKRNSIKYETRRGRLVVKPTSGQGAVFAFEASI